jgi:hypothetical protein
VWLAGAHRYAEDDSHIGFHASYINKDGALLESGVGNALVGAYLNQLGLSQSVVVYVTSAPPKGMRWLTREDSARIDLPYISVTSFLNDGLMTRTMKSEASADKYEPMSTVTKFYKSLSAGDGNSAAALVIPAKRGIGPFNELEISRFFRSMQEPLVVENIQQVSNDVVNVRYRYKKDSSKFCAGSANVTTNFVYGKTLIAKIKANC